MTSLALTTYVESGNNVLLVFFVDLIFRGATRGGGLGGSSPPA